MEKEIIKIVKMNKSGSHHALGRIYLPRRYIGRVISIKELPKRESKKYLKEYEEHHKLLVQSERDTIKRINKLNKHLRGLRELRNSRKKNKLKELKE